jgi:hypothetical protein
MRYSILPVIHKLNLRNIKPKKYHWRWRSQKEIRKILKKTTNIKYQSNMFDENIIKKTYIDEEEFKMGTKHAYYKIYENFYDQQNFLKTKYTTPELSLAINHIISEIPKLKNIEIKGLESKILTSWIEVGNASANNRLFGIWSCKHIKNEFKRSNINHCWDIYVGPLKQKVKVLYKSENRFDIWEFEKCLMEENENWCISNINEIIIH